MHKEKKVFDFLMGLDESYKIVRSQILNLKPSLSVGLAYAIMAQKENQLTVAASRSMVPKGATLMSRNQVISSAKHGSGQKVGDRLDHRGGGKDLIFVALIVIKSVIPMIPATRSLITHQIGCEDKNPRKKQTRVTGLIHLCLGLHRPNTNS